MFDEFVHWVVCKQSQWTIHVRSCPNAIWKMLKFAYNFACKDSNAGSGLCFNVPDIISNRNLRSFFENKLEHLGRKVRHVGGEKPPLKSPCESLPKLAPTQKNRSNKTRTPESYVKICIRLATYPWFCVTKTTTHRGFYLQNITFLHSETVPWDHPQLESIILAFFPNPLSAWNYWSHLHLKLIFCTLFTWYYSLFIHYSFCFSLFVFMTSIDSSVWRTSSCLNRRSQDRGCTVLSDFWHTFVMIGWHKNKNVIIVVTDITIELEVKFFACVRPYVWIYCWTPASFNEAACWCCFTSTSKTFLALLHYWCE